MPDQNTREPLLEVARVIRSVLAPHVAWTERRTVGSNRRGRCYCWSRVVSANATASSMFIFRTIGWSVVLAGTAAQLLAGADTAAPPGPALPRLGSARRVASRGRDAEPPCGSAKERWA